MIYRIPQRIRNRMEKWTAFTLVVIALLWFNDRLSVMETKYMNCMEDRVRDQKEIVKPIIHHEENQAKNTIADPPLLQATAQRNDPARRNRGGDYAITGCLASDTKNRRRVRGNGWKRWGGNLPNDQEGG